MPGCLPAASWRRRPSWTPSPDTGSAWASSRDSFRALPAAEQPQPFARGDPVEAPVAEPDPKQFGQHLRRNLVTAQAALHERRRAAQPQEQGGDPPRIAGQAPVRAAIGAVGEPGAKRCRKRLRLPKPGGDAFAGDRIAEARRVANEKDAIGGDGSRPIREWPNGVDVPDLLRVAQRRPDLSNDLPVA